MHPSAFAGPVGVGTGASAANFVPTGYVELGGDYHSVTHSFGDWSGAYLKGEIQTDPDNRWNAEALDQREFGSTGGYGSVGNTHAFDEDWYSVIDIGARTSGIYLPAYRVDAFINRKLLDERQLVATLGVGVDQFVDGHKDQSGYVGATYYFQAPFIAQAGFRFNNSTPGSVTSTSQFVALTEGEDKHHFITLRYGWGEEAYQIIGPGEALSDFHSEQVSLEWRQWLGGAWGFNMRGEEYHNPNYNRTGITLGVFDEF
jgi:YaiO family outer membrane protein